MLRDTPVLLKNTQKRIKPRRRIAWFHSGRSGGRTSVFLSGTAFVQWLGCTARLMDALIVPKIDEVAHQLEQIDS